MSWQRLIAWVRARLRAVQAPLTGRDLWSTFWGSLGLGVLLFSYFLVRPIREVQGSHFDPARLNILFICTFLSLLLITPFWGLLVRVSPRQWLPVVLFSVVSGSLLLFSRLLRQPKPSEWVSLTFYVWVSVFNYMIVSLYWSVMVDSFSQTVSRRTFGVIAAGGSTGAMLGPLAASLLAERMSASATLLLSAGLFVFVPVILLMIPRRNDTERDHQASLPKPLEDQSIFSGLMETMNTPYLLAIAGYMLMGSVLGSLLYVHQTHSIRGSISDETVRRQFFANTDLATNGLTLVLELVVSAPLLSWGGLRWSLLLLPVIGVLAAPWLTLWPSVGAVATILIVRRAVEYGLAKPSRELLFTVVTRDQKYKAKNFIDTVVARAGDSIGSSVSRVVTGFSFPPIYTLWMGVPISIGFGVLGIWLARQHHLRSSVAESVPSSVPANLKSPPHSLE